MAGEHVFVAMTPPIAMNERLLRRKLLDRLERNDLYALRDVAIASTPLRISERLRKDHPDPAIRAELYADASSASTFAR